MYDIILQCIILLRKAGVDFGGFIHLRIISQKAATFILLEFLSYVKCLNASKFQSYNYIELLFRVQPI